MAMVQFDLIDQEHLSIKVNWWDHDDVACHAKVTFEVRPSELYILVRNPGSDAVRVTHIEDVTPQSE